MKKTLTIIFSCLTLLMLSSAAFGAPGRYVSGNLGIGLLEDSDLSASDFSAELEFDAGAVLGVAAGYNFGNVRLEGEFGYAKNDMDEITVHGFGSGSVSGDVTSYSFLVNGYYDFVNTSPLTPYISAGVGFARLDASLEGDDADDDVLAYQLGAGVGYAVNEKVTIDLKYRYFATDDPKFDGTEAEYASHNIFLGVRYNF